MPDPRSPFLDAQPATWIASNALAFALPDGFPVSPGHTLVVTRRLVPTWFDATPAEQAALLDLVNTVKHHLDASLSPKPDGYNVGFNAGTAAGQTVPHVHVHVIPRYSGDVPDPRGGVRHVISAKANYLAPKTSPAPPLRLATGQAPLWNQLRWRLAHARSADILSSFVQVSGLELIGPALFEALARGAHIRLLAGDYLFITDPDALRTLHGWSVAARQEGGQFEARLWELQKAGARSFHPKAWQIHDADGTLLVVGSSNLSRTALLNGIEWNLLSDARTFPGPDALNAAATAFEDLWNRASPLSPELLAEYAKNAASFRASHAVPMERPEPVPEPRPWQVAALGSLKQLRANGCTRALVTVATGMGKTWLAAFDLTAVGRTLGRRPRVLVIAHRAQILTQAERILNRVLGRDHGRGSTGWYLGAESCLDADLVLASIQKLARPEGLARLDTLEFDYALIDEVHHAEAPTYRRVLARLRAGFLLGLTATPERADGTDIAPLFDDNLAHSATIGDGITERVLVPFHYFGIRDTVDFGQIPWRNGRFDPETLEARVATSERMESLAAALATHPGQRTLYFCVSRRHALFARDWLRARGHRAAAVFSGPETDPAADSLRAFEAGELNALCVVDMFNEGLDVPAIDRIVLLRPTESRVVFLQQLGRGLRAMPGKPHLTVLDFVGNHRVFLHRILHLLSLRNGPAPLEALRRLLDADTAELPPNCLVRLDLEAKEILRALLPRPANAALEMYRGLRDVLGRRPTLLELLQHQVAPRTLCRPPLGWPSFLQSEGDLPPDAVRLLDSGPGRFLRVAETTALNKSYKMVVLRVLLDRDAFWSGLDSEQLCADCHRFLAGHPALRDEMGGAAPEPAWIDWWTRWPLRKWLEPQGNRIWFALENGRFNFDPSVPESDRPTFETLLSEIVDYRLARYLERQTASAGTESFVCKVLHAGGRPFLKLPDRVRRSELPEGPTPVQVPSGGEWIFKFVKIACNTASPMGEGANQLPALLREWFGPNAGQPGTRFQVVFERPGGKWQVRPEQTAFVHPAGETLSDPPTLRVAEEDPGSEKPD